MALYKRGSEVPPGGWKYIQPDTGAMFKNENEPQLISIVLDHRQHRGLARATRAEVKLDIQRQICTGLGSRHCKSEGAGDTWVPRKEDDYIPTIRMIISFSKFAFDFLRSGMKMVSDKEVQRRRSICLTCPLNNPIGGCKCSFFYKLVDLAVPKERAFPDLFVCKACLCSLKAKVNVPIAIIHSAEDGRNLQFPTYCWQHPDHASAAE